jgi:hypothetical protein
MFNSTQFAPEQTLFIKAVPKIHVKKLEEAIVNQTNAKAVHSVADKDPLCPNALITYANYTSAGDAKRAQDRVERWLDDHWHFPNRPIVMIKGQKKTKGPEAIFPPEQTLVLKPVLPEKRAMLENAIIHQSQPKNLHSVQDRDESVQGALLMYANYSSIEETQRAQVKWIRCVLWVRCVFCGFAMDSLPKTANPLYLRPLHSESTWHSCLFAQLFGIRFN